MRLEDYPFAHSLITDTKGQIQQVVLNLQDYQHLLEALEDEGLYRAMQETHDEESLSLEEALAELKNL